MLHPVGNLPAHVYWRRRLFFVVLPVIGVALIAWALLSGGGDHPSPSNTASTTTKSSPSSTATTPPATLDSGSISVGTTATSTAPATPAKTTPTKTTAAKTTAAKTTAAKTTPSVAAGGTGFCAADDLTVAAGVAHPSFPVNSKPVLFMPVTNVGTTTCKLNIADKHVEWRVYTGDARVWSSHDCPTPSVPDVISVAAQQTVRLSITWSGLTSAPGCKGTRLAVQAGTYRLYAYLNGERSVATTFTIT